MQLCHLLNYPVVGKRVLGNYLRRTDWLCEGQSGALSEDLARLAGQDRHALVFLHLPDPAEAELLPAALVAHLAQHPAVIVTSPYPPQLFKTMPFKPFAFLPEPFSFEHFANCIEKYVALHG